MAPEAQVVKDEGSEKSMVSRGGKELYSINRLKVIFAMAMKIEKTLMVHTRGVYIFNVLFEDGKGILYFSLSIIRSRNRRFISSPEYQPSCPRLHS